MSQGVWVAWQADGPRHVSRVRDLSAGGVFIQTTAAVSIGTEVELLFALPEGEARVDGIVRYADGKSGLVWNSPAWAAATAPALQELLRRLNR